MREVDKEFIEVLLSRYKPGTKPVWSRRFTSDYDINSSLKEFWECLIETMML